MAWPPRAFSRYAGAVLLLRAALMGMVERDRLRVLVPLLTIIGLLVRWCSEALPALATPDRYLLRMMLMLRL